MARERICESRVMYPRRGLATCWAAVGVGVFCLLAGNSRKATLFTLKLKTFHTPERRRLFAHTRVIPRNK